MCAVLLGALLAGPATLSVAAAAQQLSMSIHGDGAQATKLPQYDPSEPIDVRVRETRGQKLDAVTLLAGGPSGKSLHVPLVRGADGSFGGALVLQDRGVWNVRLTSRAGKISVATSPVTLDIEAPPPSNAWEVGVAVAAAIFIVIGGGGFLILRRVMRGGHAPHEAQAA